MRLTYQRAHRLGKLHEELLAAIPALRPADERAVMLVSGDGQKLTLQVPDGSDEAAIAAVVAAHDAATPGAWEQAQAAAGANEATLRDRVDQSLAQLEQAYGAWATLTANQKDAALRQTVRVVAGLGRLVLRKLDAA